MYRSTPESSKDDHNVGYLPNKPYVLLKYMWDLHNHLWKKLMLFKLESMDEACVQAQYRENINQKKGKSSGTKKKEHQGASKESKRKLKGGY